jgi:hypothetical protein
LEKSQSKEMINKSHCIFIFTLLFFHGMHSQVKKDSLVMQIHLKFGVIPLELQKKYISTSDTLEIETFKLYVSNIEIDFADNTRIKPKNNYHLIDIENPNSLSIPIALKQNKAITKVTFNVGIDSTASVSGALGGDLDASKGMYWAWQSGYINMKIEGKSNSCPTRKNQFHFHLGGYLKPNSAMRTVVLEATKPTETLVIAVDLEKLFSQIELSKNNNTMIPGKLAMYLSDLAAKMFSIE